MQIALWIINGFLALAFLGTGGLKLARPKEALGLPWVEDFSARSVKLIGLAEVLGAVGLIVPRLTGIAPVLTPIAALCLLAIMIGAIATHLRRKENPAPSVVLVVLLVVSAVLGFALLGS